MSSAMKLCYNEHTELGTNDFHYRPFNLSKYWIYVDCEFFIYLFDEDLLAGPRASIRK